MGIQRHVVRSRVILATFLSGAIAGQVAHATDLFLTDFDDTLAETRVAAGGTFGTEYKLKLVNPTALMPDISGMADVIWLSPQDEESGRI